MRRACLKGGYVSKTSAPSFGKELASELVPPIFVASVIIASGYIGSQLALWSGEHTWIFTQGVLLVLGVWCLSMVVLVTLRRMARLFAAPATAKPTKSDKSAKPATSTLPPLGRPSSSQKGGLLSRSGSSRSPLERRLPGSSPLDRKGGNQSSLGRDRKNRDERPKGFGVPFRTTAQRPAPDEQDPPLRPLRLGRRSEQDEKKKRSASRLSSDSPPRFGPPYPRSFSDYEDDEDDLFAEREPFEKAKNDGSNLRRRSPFDDGPF